MTTRHAVACGITALADPHFVHSTDPSPAPHACRRTVYWCSRLGELHAKLMRWLWSLIFPFDRMCLPKATQEFLSGWGKLFSKKTNVLIIFLLTDPGEMDCAVSQWLNWNRLNQGSFPYCLGKCRFVHWVCINFLHRRYRGRGLMAFHGANARHQVVRVKPSNLFSLLY